MERAVEREWKQSAWRGSPGALADLVAEVASLVKEASGGDDEPHAHVTLQLAGDAGELSFKSVAEFEEFCRDHASTVARTRRFYARIGHQVEDVGVTLIIRRYWFMASAVDAAVRGRNAVAVNGVAPEVRALLRAAGQLVPSWALYWGTWAFGLLLAVAAIPVSGPAAKPLWIAGYSIMFGAVAFGAASPILWPHFEVIEPGAPRRGAARVRAALADSGKWFAAAVAGAVIYAVIDRLI